MKLHLIMLSFIPLLMLFFVSIWFRIAIFSMILLLVLIFWLMLMPFLIVFISEMLLDKKGNSANKGNGSDVAQKKK